MSRRNWHAVTKLPLDRGQCRSRFAGVEGSPLLGDRPRWPPCFVVRPPRRGRSGPMIRCQDVQNRAIRPAGSDSSESGSCSGTADQRSDGDGAVELTKCSARTPPSCAPTARSHFSPKRGSRGNEPVNKGRGPFNLPPLSISFRLRLQPLAPCPPGAHAHLTTHSTAPFARPLALFSSCTSYGSLHQDQLVQSIPTMLTHNHPRAPRQLRPVRLARLALLASTVLFKPAVAAPAGPLRLATQASGYVDGLSADIGALLSANFTHVIVGGGNCKLAYGAETCGWE